MKTLKFVLLAAFSLCLMSTVDAQNASSNKLKTKHSMAAYQCPMKCEADKVYAKSGKCPVCKMALTKVKVETATYKCPMLCEGDKSYAIGGKCPVCKINLTRAMASKPKNAEHENHNHN